jgi:PAS domain S-box-containing protein
MPKRRRVSIRLWQTELFVIVIVVAILILSGSLSAGLRITLSEQASARELRNASALARRLEVEFPVTLERLTRIREITDEYRTIYGAGSWVYDSDGTLLEAAAQGGPADAVLEEARTAGLSQTEFVRADIKPRGWAIAAETLWGEDDSVVGVVVSASSVEGSLAVLDAVRNRLWVAFWVALSVAGLLGFVFSEFIGRRIRAMSDAAVAIAAGDFEQRLPTGLIPDEVYDLAASYNSMASKLGEAFGSIKESQRQIAAVVESMAEGVVAFDSVGVVRVVNPEALRLLGSPDAELVGTPMQDMTSESSVLDIVATGLAGDSAVRTITLGSHTVLLHCTPLLGAEGEVDGAVLLLSDVTEQRRIHEAQRRFVADASHELRTPIAAIKGMLELLADGAIDDREAADDFIKTMQDEADRLGRLVSDLLLLAKLESGSLRLDLRPVRAAEILGDVAGVMQTLAEGAGVEVTVEVPDGDPQVLADRDKVVQVLLSFTDNALKHSPRGSYVHLRATQRDAALLLEVADEGPGIEPDKLERVFERFYRADVARSGGGGAGLGLAIAKEIVEAHDSSIEVRSERGVGTTFGFELPSVTVSEDGAETDDAHVSEEP